MGYVPTVFLKDLKDRLAGNVADAKAYDVPRICSRLGLADGEESEAFSSKFRYVRSRLEMLSREQLLAAAHIYLEEYDQDYWLLEAASKIEELNGKRITEITRKRILDVFGQNELCSEIEMLDFVRRVWPIDKMPAHYRGDFQNDNLEADIYQHCIRNDDWTTRQLLENLGLMNCSQRQVFRFLEEVTHPMVQTEERQRTFAHYLNKILVHDGFELSVASEISGCPIYKVREVKSGSPADKMIADALEAFDPDTIHLRWEKAIQRRASDPENAITLARTLLEDVCKWIIHEAGGGWKENDDITDLYKKTSKLLKLAPDDHTEQIFKQILGGCNSIVLGLGSLRNKISDAHSAGPKRVKPHARHAELAVNLSGTMATFLVETWRARRDGHQISNKLPEDGEKQKI